MATHAHMSQSHSPHDSPSNSTAMLIQIPANEFSNDTNTACSPPPSRLVSRSGAKLTSNIWEKRLHDAAAVRNASLEQMRHRCKDHIDHVASVVNGVKETRRQDSAARHQHLTSMQREAAERRRQLLAKRTQDSTDARVRRARILRERSAEQKMADVQSARKARKEAEQRRGRLLSEKKKRASCFAPRRRIAPLAMRSPSPDRMSDDTCSSPSSMSTASREEEEMSQGFSSSTESSPQSMFSERRCIPRSVADNVPKMMSLDSDTDADAQEGPPSKKTVPSDNEIRAARKIAGYYLLYKARKAMSVADVLGPELSSYSFEKTTSLLEGSSAQHAADLLFQALGMRNHKRRMTSRDAMREQTERRILLSCLIVALHPEAVMEEKVRRASAADGFVSVDCFAVYTARRLLLCLHVGTLGAVADAWVQWRRAFMKWKKNDAEVLLSAMVEDAIATEALRAAVKRRFLEAEGEDSMRSTLGATVEAASLRQQEHAVWEEQLDLKQQKIRESVVKLSGARGEQRLDAAIAASRQVQDERIVHEIMIDLLGLLERIQSPSRLSDEVWDRLQTELSLEPPQRNELASRLHHISTLLNGMIPGCFSLGPDVNPVHLDGDFAVNLVCRVVTVLEKCQAEVLDDALREWADASVVKLRAAGQTLVAVVVDVFREMTEFVEAVHRSIVSFRIRNIAPVVQQYGAAWERSHFQGHVVSGVFSSQLPRTRNLLSQALACLGPKQIPLRQELYMGVPSAVRTLVTRGILNLLVKPHSCRQDDLPELMYLDFERILKMQNDVQKCALAGSLDNIAKQFLHCKDSRMASADGFQEILEVLSKENPRLEEIQETFVSWISTALGDLQSITDSEMKLLKSMVERITRPGDTMFALMQKRVEKTVFDYSLRTQQDEATAFSNRGSDSAEPGGRTLGLEAVEDLLKELGKATVSLVNHLLRVHGASLASIMKSLYQG